MGLDMYLYKRIYVGANWEHHKVHGVVKLQADGKPLPINLKRLTSVTEVVGQWRKANAIHNWFVTNVQKGEDDCGEYMVGKVELEKLLDECKKVKHKIEEPEDILPTKKGFFFGSTEYNGDYMSDIDYTIEICITALAEFEEGDFYYHSSW